MVTLGVGNRWDVHMHFYLKARTSWAGFRGVHWAKKPGKWPPPVMRITPPF